MNATDAAIDATGPGSPIDPIEIPPPPPSRPVEWRRAVRALRALLADPDQTEKAFEVFLALDGDQEERNFQRLLAHPDGRRLAAARPCLLSRLSDRRALAALPEGSFGRAYLVYLDRTGLDPGGLVKLKAEMEAYAKSVCENLPVLDPVREWLRVRGILMHDLWHVLTDYGTDEIGEAALLAFSYAQLPGRAHRLLVLGAASRGVVEHSLGFARYLYQAWRRGRRAVWLFALPYEQLLDQPLGAVRAMANIEAGDMAHPAGILRGTCSRTSPAVSSPAAH
jgi:ubiquinone biosynthesis protein COQ4